jgi:hypothetical protein
MLYRPDYAGPYCQADHKRSHVREDRGPVQLDILSFTSKHWGIPLLTLLDAIVVPFAALRHVVEKITRGV